MIWTFYEANVAHDCYAHVLPHVVSLLKEIGVERARGTCCIKNCSVGVLSI